MNTLNVLLIEDTSSTVDLLKEAILDSGHDIHLDVFSDGDDALRYLRSASKFPPLILLDLNLPGRSGLEILRDLKGSEKLRAIPVIILTNSNSPDDVLKAYAAHCNAYIRKPMGFDTVVDAIKTTGKFWFEVASLPSAAEASLP